MLKPDPDKRLLTIVFTAIAVTTTLFLGACSDSVSNFPVEAYLDTQATQIGGATSAVAYYKDSGNEDWTLYSMANRFAATKIPAAPAPIVKGAVTEITAPGYIENIAVISYNAQDYALLSMGNIGIGIVNITNPAAMVYLRTITVDYDTPEYTYVDGGGTQFTEAAASHTAGTVNYLLVDDNNTPTDYTDDQLYIANGDFGIQKNPEDAALQPDGYHYGWRTAGFRVHCTGMDAQIRWRKPLGRPTEPDPARWQAVCRIGFHRHRHL